MTVIELMVVLLIVAGMSVAGVAVFSQVTRAELKAQSLRMSGMIRHTYGQAAIHQQYYRMVFDIDSAAYWVEVAPKDRPGQAPTIPEQELIGAPEGNDFGKKRGKKGAKDADSEAIVQRPRFQQTEDGVIRRRQLNEGIRIHSIFTPSEQDGITEGRTSITFFPNGFVERCTVILTDGNDGFRTLEIQPLTGKVRILSGRQEPDRGFFEPEEAR